MNLYKQHIYKAGKILNSGSYGCVFYPSINCSNSKSNYNTISKLMTYKDAVEEYKKSIEIKNILIKHFPEYEKYIILSENICSISFLSKSDLENFYKCYLFENMGVTPETVNDNLQNLLVLNQKYGGIELQKYLQSQSQNNIGKILLKMASLIKLCIVPINKLEVYHSDLKADNLLVDKDNLYIIDWGIAIIQPTLKDFAYVYKFTFNAPFGNILFGDKFRQFCRFKTTETEATYNVNLIKELIDKNDKSLMLIREIIDKFGVQRNCIEEYLIKILSTYTKEEYFNIFMHNIDIWGIVICIIDLPYDYNNREFVKSTHLLMSYLYTHPGYLDIAKISKFLRLIAKSISKPKSKKYLKISKTKKKSNI